MDVSLESALSQGDKTALQDGRIAGRTLEDWNSAYAKVESYFHALRVRNKVYLGRLIIQVLNRAMRRAPMEPERPVTEIAAEEMDRLVTEWFGEVLGASPAGTEHMLSTRGRLALLLADMPGKWQEQFLRPAPWPEEFVGDMRAMYLRAGPDFQLSQMAPRPLDLGPISTFTNISRLPYTKMVSIWLLFALALAALFLFTHGF